MSGHSKWATTRRHKAAVDAKRGKLFSLLSKELTIAARDGGADLDSNPRLRTVMLKAKQANMPMDNIQRAVKKGTGELPGVNLESFTYEGYGPGGIGVIVEGTTDNKNRTVSEVRSTFSKMGGNLAASGAVAFNFDRMGQFFIDSKGFPKPRKGLNEDLVEWLIDVGAEDLIDHGNEGLEVLCAVSRFDALAECLDRKKGIEVQISELVYVPKTRVLMADVETARRVFRLIETLEALEDVKDVFANFDIKESLSKVLNSAGDDGSHQGSC